MSGATPLRSANSAGVSHAFSRSSQKRLRAPWRAAAESLRARSEPAHRHPRQRRGSSPGTDHSIGRQIISEVLREFAHCGTPTPPSTTTISFDLSSCDFAMNSPTLGREFATINKTHYGHPTHTKQFGHLLCAHENICREHHDTAVRLKHVEHAKQSYPRRICCGGAIAGRSPQHIGDRRAQSPGIIMRKYACHHANPITKRSKRTLICAPSRTACG